jgi:hypothetical protein
VKTTKDSKPVLAWALARKDSGEISVATVTDRREVLGGPLLKRGPWKLIQVEIREAKR